MSWKKENVYRITTITHIIIRSGMAALNLSLTREEVKLEKTPTAAEKKDTLAESELDQWFLFLCVRFFSCFSRFVWIQVHYCFRFITWHFYSRLIPFFTQFLILEKDGRFFFCLRYFCCCSYKLVQHKFMNVM